MTNELKPNKNNAKTTTQYVCCLLVPEHLKQRWSNDARFSRDFRGKGGTIETIPRCPSKEPEIAIEEKGVQAVKKEVEPTAQVPISGLLVRFGLHALVGSRCHQGYVPLMR